MPRRYAALLIERVEGGGRGRARAVRAGGVELDPRARTLAFVARSGSGSGGGGGAGGGVGRGGQKGGGGGGGGRGGEGGGGGVGGGGGGEGEPEAGAAGAAPLPALAANPHNDLDDQKHSDHPNPSDLGPGSRPARLVVDLPALSRQDIAVRWRSIALGAPGPTLVFLAQADHRAVVDFVLSVCSPHPRPANTATPAIASEYTEKHPTSMNTDLDRGLSTNRSSNRSYRQEPRPHQPHDASFGRHQQPVNVLPSRGRDSARDGRGSGSGDYASLSQSAAAEAAAAAEIEQPRLDSQNSLRRKLSLAALRKRSSSRMAFRVLKPPRHVRSMNEVPQSEKEPMSVRDLQYPEPRHPDVIAIASHTLSQESANRLHRPALDDDSSKTPKKVSRSDRKTRPNDEDARFRLSSALEAQAPAASSTTDCVPVVAADSETKIIVVRSSKGFYRLVGVIASLVVVFLALMIAVLVHFRRHVLIVEHVALTIAAPNLARCKYQ